MHFVSRPHTQGPKLGSEDDPVRMSLYAAHPVRELLQTVDLAGATGALPAIAEACALAEAGQTAEAIARYRLLLTQPGLETQLTLWIWNGLRELGQKPTATAALEVLGAIIEVPMKNGYDTLAAYADGTARFLSFKGSAIFWDQPDTKIKQLIQRFIDASIPVATQARPRTTLALPKGHAQVTLLTRGGLYVIAKPSGPLIEAGAALMMELVTRNRSRAPA